MIEKNTLNRCSPIFNECIKKGKNVYFALAVIVAIGSLTAASFGLAGLGNCQGWWNTYAFSQLTQTFSTILLVSGLVFAGGAIFVCIMLKRPNTQPSNPNLNTSSDAPVEKHHSNASSDTLAAIPIPDKYVYSNLTQEGIFRIPNCVLAKVLLPYLTDKDKIQLYYASKKFHPGLEKHWKILCDANWPGQWEKGQVSRTLWQKYGQVSGKPLALAVQGNRLQMEPLLPHPFLQLGFLQLVDNRLVYVIDPRARDSIIKIIDLQTGIEKTHQNQDLHEGLNGLKVIGNKVFFSDSNNRIIIWNLNKTGDDAYITLGNGHTGAIRQFQVIDNMLVSGSDDKTIRIWDLQTGVCKKVLEGHTAKINYLEVAGNTIVSASSDGTIRIWDLQNGVCKKVIKASVDVSGLRMTDNAFIYSCVGERSIMVRNLQTGSCERELKDWAGGHISCTEIIGNTLVASQGKIIKIWDLSTGAKKVFEGGHTYGIAALKVLGNLIVSASYDGVIRISDLESGICMKELKIDDKKGWIKNLWVFNHTILVSVSGPRFRQIFKWQIK